MMTNTLNPNTENLSLVTQIRATYFSLSLHGARTQSELLAREKQILEKEINMKKPKDEKKKEVGELREHYDFDYTKAKPNRFAEKFNGETVVVVLDPDVASAFPTAEAVNEALRLVMKLSAIPAVPPHG
jgi:hypothetical protein